MLVPVIILGNHKKKMIAVSIYVPTWGQCGRCHDYRLAHVIRQHVGSAGETVDEVSHRAHTATQFKRTVCWAVNSARVSQGNRPLIMPQPSSKCSLSVHSISHHLAACMSRLAVVEQSTTTAANYAFHPRSYSSHAACTSLCSRTRRGHTVSMYMISTSNPTRLRWHWDQDAWQEGQGRQRSQLRGRRRVQAE